MQEAIDEGYPITDLTFIEYAAEANTETGFFQKHAAYFVAGNVIPANIVNDRNWVAKHGEANLATPELYALEKAQLGDYPFSKWVAEVFKCAQLDFGRVDFGVVNGRPQAYEINTNPVIYENTKHENPDRAYSLRIIRNRILDALVGLATAPDAEKIGLHSTFRRSRMGRLKRL